MDLLYVEFDPDDHSLVGQISPFVSALVNDYHYVVVNLPNEMDEIVFETLAQSDIVHLITHDRKKDLQVTKQVISNLKRVLKESFRKEKVQVIISGMEQKCYLSYEEINKVLDYNVMTMLPHIQRSQLSKAVVFDGMTVIAPNLNSEYSKLVSRIARRIGGVLVGLVLGGGAALGVAHVGVIKVLEKENIPIDIVVGSSMGALIGGIWATGKSAEEMESVAREFQSKSALWKLMDLTIPPISGFINGRFIVRWLKKHLGSKTFYSTEIPFKAVAYDLIRREEMVIDEGSLVDGIRQSIAIPGVIRPIKKKDQLIIDGGVLNPLPTNILARYGVKKIIAVNVLQSPEQVSIGYDVLQKKLREDYSTPFYKSPMKYINVRFSRAMMKIFDPNIPDIIIRTLQATEYILAEQSGQQADVLLHPDLTGIQWFELYRVDELLRRGEEVTRKNLPAIKQLIKA